MKEKNTKKNILIISMMVVISLAGAVLIAAANVNQPNIRACAKDLLYGRGALMEEKTFQPFDLQHTGYKVEGDTFSEEEENAKIYLNDINDYVSDVTVVLGEAAPRDFYLKFYYGASEAEDDAGVFYAKNMEKGLTQKTFEIRKKVSGLRVSIATEDGEAFELDHIAINENAEPFSIGRLLRCIKENMAKRFLFDRAELLFVFFLFILLHFVVDRKKMYAFLFDKRWIVAGVILCFLVINRYHGDSLAMYDYTIQPGQGSDYVQPLLGRARAIRSDEWVVSSPTRLSTQFLDDPYGKYNTIIRGEKTINDGNIGISTIINPVSWVNLFLTECIGFEYGYSFAWYAPIFLTFLFSIEFFMILSGKDKLLSTCGACMIVLSSYFLWWGFPSFLMNAPAALTCAWHFVHTRQWKYKIPLAYGTGLFTAGFVMLLYPAWQVPLGYTVIAILVWMIHDSWDVIRKMDKKEWTAIIVTLIATVAVVGLYLRGRQEYIETITKTEYPGSRIDYGGFTLKKLFNYIPAMKFAFADVGNASEAGACISFFPLPFLGCLWLWIRSKKKDWLVSGLLLVSLFLFAYTTVGLPPILAKVTLMTMATADRAVDILGYIQVILFVCIFSRFADVPRAEKKWGAALSVVFGVASVVLSNHYLPNYMGRIYMIICCVLVAAVAYACISNVSMAVRQRALVLIILMSLVTGAYVRPLCKGLDAIYSKPVAKAIMEITKEEKDAKWLAYSEGVEVSSFAIACGAPTVNSVNTYPNMRLWKLLDPEGQYNEVYNRYAHIGLKFTQGKTFMELIQQDCIRLNLSYDDIKKTEAKYILSVIPMEEQPDGVRFDEVYNEAGCYIYRIEYLQ